MLLVLSLAPFAAFGRCRAATHGHHIWTGSIDDGVALLRRKIDHQVLMRREVDHEVDRDGSELVLTQLPDEVEVANSAPLSDADEGEEFTGEAGIMQTAAAGAPSPRPARPMGNIKISKEPKVSKQQTSAPLPRPSAAAHVQPTRASVSPSPRQSALTSSHKAFQTEVKQPVSDAHKIESGKSISFDKPGLPQATQPQVKLPLSETHKVEPGKRSSLDKPGSPHASQTQVKQPLSNALKVEAGKTSSLDKPGSPQASQAQVQQPVSDAHKVEPTKSSSPAKPGSPQASQAQVQQPVSDAHKVEPMKSSSPGMPGTKATRNAATAVSIPQNTPSSGASKESKQQNLGAQSKLGTAKAHSNATAKANNTNISSNVMKRLQDAVEHKPAKTVVKPDVEKEKQAEIDKLKATIVKVPNGNGTTKMTADNATLSNAEFRRQLEEKEAKAEQTVAKPTPRPPLDNGVPVLSNEVQDEIKKNDAEFRKWLEERESKMEGEATAEKQKHAAPPTPAQTPLNRDAMRKHLEETEATAESKVHPSKPNITSIPKKTSNPAEFRRQLEEKERLEEQTPAPPPKPPVQHTAPDITAEERQEAEEAERKRKEQEEEAERRRKEQEEELARKLAEEKKKEEEEEAERRRKEQEEEAERKRREQEEELARKLAEEKKKEEEDLERQEQAQEAVFEARQHEAEKKAKQEEDEWKARAAQSVDNEVEKDTGKPDLLPKDIPSSGIDTKPKKEESPKPCVSVPAAPTQSPSETPLSNKERWNRLIVASHSLDD